MLSLPGKPDLSAIAKIDREVIPFTRRCENNGLFIDVEWLRELSSHLDSLMKEEERYILEYVPRQVMDDFTSESLKQEYDVDYDHDSNDYGRSFNYDRDFNVDSPDQIARLLFQHLHIGDGHELTMTASGNRVSTGRKQLERFKKDHPVIPHILQRREYFKLKSTYTSALPDAAVWEPGYNAHKIYYKIGLTFTSTGRMTCARLHQIPIRTEVGRLIRYAFHAGLGRKLISADYAGLELRVLAHCAKERVMLDVFSHPSGDIHQKTQDGLNMPASMDKIQKRLASKRTNFGICLSQGQRLLTNVGLVPIENLTTNMLLWDGIDWVRHGGVVFNGYKEVITWDGLTATPDHKVWTGHGRVLELVEARRQGLRLAVTGIETVAFKYLASELSELPEYLPLFQLPAQGLEYCDVYDVIDVGPRHRFTAEGKLVSNCYGTSDLGLWLTLQSDGVPCTREQCREFQQAFHDTYPDVAPYISKIHQRGRRYKFVWNEAGRVTLAPEFCSVHNRIVREGERRVQNFVIQSLATDIFKTAAKKIDDFCSEVREGLLGRPYYMEPLLAIHDQVIIGADEEIADEAAEYMKTIMEDAVQLRAPLKIDSHVEERWSK